jgi:crossover junction endodeoxyribonuclease RusA
MILAFRVYGVASGMGSKRAFVPRGWTRPIVTDSNRNLKTWQTLVADAASLALSEVPAADRQVLTGPVRLTIAFYLPRPKSLPKRVQACTKAPDTSKLVRALEDALTRIVYHDDAQVVELVAGKFYAAAGAVPHIDVRVEPTAGDVPLRVPAAPLPLFSEVCLEPTAGILAR